MLSRLLYSLCPSHRHRHNAGKVKISEPSCRQNLREHLAQPDLLLSAVPCFAAPVQRGRESVRAPQVEELESERRGHDAVRANSDALEQQLRQTTQLLLERQAQWEAAASEKAGQVLTLERQLAEVRST